MLFIYIVVKGLIRKMWDTFQTLFVQSVSASGRKVVAIYM